MVPESKRTGCPKSSGAASKAKSAVRMGYSFPFAAGILNSAGSMGTLGSIFW